MRVLDWYSGIGGWTRAFLAAGHEVVGACERDDDRRAVYAAHYGEPAWFPRDCMATDRPPADADLWCACAGVCDLEAFVSGPVARWSPRWLLLETVPEPLDGVLAGLGAYPHVTTVNGRGRVYVVAGPAPSPVDRLPDVLRRSAPHPGKYRDADDADEAQGFPRGYTAAAGASPERRRAMLGGSVWMDVAAFFAAACA